MPYDRDEGEQTVWQGVKEVCVVSPDPELSLLCVLLGGGHAFFPSMLGGHVIKVKSLFSI